MISSLMKMYFILYTITIPISPAIRSYVNATENLSTSKSVNKNYVVALILARGGSKGVAKKNLATLENKTLLRRTIEVALNAKVFDSVWVSADTLDIYEEARRAGASVFGRSEITATDTASSLSAVKEFYEFFPNISTIALLQCTSPFQSTLHLKKAFLMMQTFHYDSVFTVTRTHKLRWKQHSANGTWQPLNFNLKVRPRRQMLNEFTENGMFYWFSAGLLNSGVLQGGKIGVVEVPATRSLEIDSYDDLDYARYLAKKLLPQIKDEEQKCFLEEQLWLR